MLSYARKVKEEIVFNDFNEDCSKALLCALIKVSGTLHLGGGLSLTIRSENAKIAAKMHKMIKEIYHPQLEFRVSKKMKLNKNNVYILKVSKAKEILEDLDLIDGLGFHNTPSERIVFNDETKRAYLAGIFLASGSVNNPDTSNYHLEMSVVDEEQADYICDLMNSYNLHAKTIKRRSKYVIYLKSAEKIGDFLRAIGASSSVMEFEMTRIDRSMANTVNRWNNCDIANEIKAQSAAEKQIADIAYVIDKAGLEVLDEKTALIANIRLENPDLSLSELAEVYLVKTGKTISKSGLHHRFKKIKEEADRLRSLDDDD